MARSLVAPRGDTFTKNSGKIGAPTSRAPTDRAPTNRAPTDHAPKVFAPTNRAPAKRGIFRRLLDAVIAARLRQAEREIARFLQARGGKLNDDAEREIERRFLPDSTKNLRSSRRQT